MSETTALSTIKIHNETEHVIYVWVSKYYGPITEDDIVRDYYYYENKSINSNDYKIFRERNRNRWYSIGFSFSNDENGIRHGIYIHVTGDINIRFKDFDNVYVGTEKYKISPI